MKGLAIPIAAMFLLAGCVNPLDPIGARKAETSIAASCQMWDEMAMEAASPNPQTIARHDAMLRKAAALDAQNNIGDAAQAKIEADDLYDWQRKHAVAVQCWKELGEFHEDNESALARIAADAARMRSASLPPIPHSIYQAPAAPEVPSAPLPSTYQPPPPPAQYCIGQIPVNSAVGLPCPQ
jgi:hypothetical protein